MRVLSSTRSPLVLALSASNTLLVVHLLFPKWGSKLYAKLCSLLNMRCRERLPGSPISAGALGGLVDEDYEPPLPKPVADALERSRLCFLATTGAALEPHLSLMRFTYTTGLDPAEPHSEVCRRDRAHETLASAHHGRAAKFSLCTAFSYR